MFYKNNLKNGLNIMFVSYFPIRVKINQMKFRN